MLAACLAGAAAGQAPGSIEPPKSSEVVLFLSGNQRPLLRLAFPKFSDDPSTALVRQAAIDIEETLRADLQDSGIFQIQGPQDLVTLSLSGDLDQDADALRGLGNEVLLTATVKAEGSRAVLEGRVADLPSRQLILGKRYAGEPSWARRIAHTFADEIVRHFTGQPGIALTQIAFSSDRSGNKEIYLMDADGRDPRPVSSHHSISLGPVWRGAGDLLAYVSFFGGTPGVYFAELASGRKRPFVTDGSFNSSPGFSPDGKQVAFARSLSGNVEIFLADANGGNLRRLTHSPGIDTNPAWSPDGQSIAFTSSRGGGPQIYVMDTDGTNVRRVTFRGDYNDGAGWHPRQPSLVYSTRQGNRFNLATVDLVTLETRDLTTGEGSKESPSYSPDGRKLAFSWELRGRRDIYVLDLASGALRALTSEGRHNADPAWSPFMK
jgi:TolB protein